MSTRQCAGCPMWVTGIAYEGVGRCGIDGRIVKKEHECHNEGWCGKMPYRIKLRRKEKDKALLTRYSFDFGDTARVWASGYQQALADCGHNHSVLVYDPDGRLYYNAKTDE